MLLLLVGYATWASPSVLKIATVAPQGSPWENTLRELSGRVMSLTDGGVEIKIYPDGIAGDEPDLVRKMRLGRLQGAALTQLALASIVPEILALSTPFLVETNEEFAFLLDRLSEQLTKRFADEGFVVLAFAEAGWVHFFSAKTIETPADLEHMRLAVPADEGEMLYIWRHLGYAAFPLSIPDYAMGLQTGMVDAFYAPPSLVAAFGWMGKIGFMNALPVAPVLGAIVFTRQSWNSLSADEQEIVRRLAKEAGEAITASSRQLESDSISVMEDNGVTVVESSSAEQAKWRALGTAGAKLAVGRIFSEAALEQVQRLLAEYRSSAEH